MERLARRFRFRRRRYGWESLTSSIGEKRGIVGKGRYTCWEVVGPVREAWDKLRPEIKEFIEESCRSGPGLTLEIYMVGRTEETAAPKVFICSGDVATRKEIRRSIMESGILNSYPAIGLGDRDPNQRIGRLAEKDIGMIYQPTLYPGDETVVLSVLGDNAFGRRLFIPNPTMDTLRPATAGPILHINGKIYQLTVGHAFIDVDESNILEASSNLDDWDFDGQSDSEEEDSPVDPETTLQDNVQLGDAPLPGTTGPLGTEISAESGQSTSLVLSSSPTSVIGQPSFHSDGKPSNQTTTVNSDSPQIKKPKIPRRLDRIGTLASFSESGTQESLDYELIELEGIYRNGTNEVPCGPNGSQRWLRVIKVARIGSGDIVNVVTMAASSGFLRGKLYATASYMRLPNQRSLQEVYVVRLNGKLADGDCGSAIVDEQDGHLYGHIVAGSVGSGMAYIVPAMQIFEDIVTRLGGDVTLIPPIEPTRSKLASKDYSRLEPHRVVEFASKEYFVQRSQNFEFNKDQKNNHSSSTTVSPFVSPTHSEHECPGTPCVRTTNPTIDHLEQQKGWSLPKKSRLPSPMITFGSSILALRPKASASVFRTKRVERRDVLGGQENIVPQVRNQRETLNVTDMRTFEQWFFALPTPSQICIITNLSAPEILNLRLVAKCWYNLISNNEAAISRDFLLHNPVPRFAISLYPLPSPSMVDLRYISGLHHRLVVASKLSEVMTKWITEEIFLRRTEEQLLEFKPARAHMHRRLVPLLFTIFHFLEMHRRLHLKGVLERGQDMLRGTSTINIESQIMSMYDDDTLLQVHQVFPLLVSCLCRMLRPPSYLGSLERSLRGYRKGPPPFHVHVAILCIGGLRTMLEFSEIEEYEARRAAVDAWYASILHDTTSLESQFHFWQPGQGRRQSGQASFSSSEGGSINTTSTHSSIFSSTGPDGSHASQGRSSSCGSLVSDTGLVTSLSQKVYTRQLLPDLPTLQKLWVPTAEALLGEREVVERPQDIKKNAQVILELVQDRITDTDELMYGQRVQTAPGDEALVWGGLVQEVCEMEGDGPMRYYRQPKVT